ncbi:helix-turn-helix transcriptional regulator [Flavobacterium sp. RSB2_4_14]|uniref:helix-turn-helix transcriptional regulator n=1 Tax=Flavobacterium sp. RSB2_4_14 TaxID=3447665 RepID=UPI003F3B4D8B
MSIPNSAIRRYKVIDLLLRNTWKPYPTMRDIQEACDDKLSFFPSVHTIEKDIRNMKSSEPVGFDAPIKYCRKNMGYYYTDPNFSINTIRLTEHDIDSIKESIELLQNIGGSRVSIRFKQAIDKILTTYKEEFPESDTNRKLIQTDYVNGSRGFKNFDILFSACKNKTPISFVHYSFQKREYKSVIVHPILLKEFDNRWYLIGFSEHHNTLRTFGFDRIYEPIPLKRKYVAVIQTDVDLYCNDIYGVYPYENQPKQKVIFKTTPLITNYFESYPIHETQQSDKNQYGFCKFTIEVVPTFELVRLLRSYGEEIKVISPDWIKSEVKNK